MKKNIILKRFSILLLVLLLTTSLFSSCEKNTNETTSVNQEENTILPKTNKDLAEFLMKAIKQDEYTNLYKYASEDLKKIIDEEAFIDQFKNEKKIGGNLQSYTFNQPKDSEGYTVFEVEAQFDNFSSKYNISTKDTKISGFFIKDKFFKDGFIIKKDNKITEKRFLYKQNDMNINACYTFIDDNQKHPLVILIPGSGVSDLDSTMGVLKQFEDIANLLAKNGINSIRMDKITVNFADKFKSTDKIYDEYSNFYSIVDYAKELENVSDIHLLGHSLGGVIAADIAKDSKDIKSIIVLNSTARNMGDLLYDQLKNLYPDKESEYKELTQKIINANESNCKGEDLFGASDYYWASLNKIDTIANIKKANVDTLIINSGNDSQAFDADVNLWKSSFSSNPKVKLETLEKSSHIVYEINYLPTNQTSLYKKASLPEKFEKIIMDFLK